MAGALAGAVAWAQEPAPSGNYGGGAIVDPGKSITGPGSMIISLRATPNGKVQILAGVGARCPTAAIKADATLAPDGSFAASGTATERFDGGRARTKYQLAGVISGAGASGTASAKSTFTRRGRQSTCKTGLVSWGARRPTGEIGTSGAAAPIARLYGTTSQRVGKRRHAIVMRVSADGKRLTRTLYTLNYRCGRMTTNIPDSPRDKLSIAADGSVSDVERYSVKLDRRTRGRFTERFSARVGSAGATGSFNLKARIIDIRSGRTIARCRSGTVKFTAAL